MASQSPERQQGAVAQRNEQPLRPPLPPDSRTSHSLSVGTRTLDYAAVAGSIVVEDKEGARDADMFYVAYFGEHSDSRRRPITFVMNGGPGGSSVFLHLGVLGPKRIDFGGQGDSPSRIPDLLDNELTWLRFSDLVFVDPVGTGYSRTAHAGGQAGTRYLGVNEDVQCLARFISAFLAQYHRMASPKYFVGESYGAFRAPKLAHELASQFGISFVGMFLISPTLDFSMLSESELNPVLWATRLPSMAAAYMLQQHEEVTVEMLAEVEEYAFGQYLVDLTRGCSDAAAVERIAVTLCSYTGIEKALLNRLRGRLDIKTFQREFLRSKAEVVSAYDLTLSGLDAYPYSREDSFDDPLLIPIVSPLTAAMVEYLQGSLQFSWKEPYITLDLKMWTIWNYSDSSMKEKDPTALPSSIKDLRKILALDPRLRIRIAHGLTDVVTPYCASRFILAQLPSYGDSGRVRLSVYPGGHMFYSRKKSRCALWDDAQSFYE